MTKTPKVSVIVPVYNVEKYIEECLKSLINQTLKDIEIICIDDCGTDNSMAIVEKYAKQDNRIKIIRHKKNAGLAASRNTGLDNSVAPYIMCCDSDDFYDKTMCATMYDAIKKSGADIAMCGINIIYEADENLKQSDDEYYRIKYRGVRAVTNDLINSCDVSSWNKIFVRKIIDKYNIRWPDGLKYEDAYFFRIYMLWAKKIKFINKKIYNYRRRTGSIMNQTFKKCDNSAIDHLKIAILIYDYLVANGLYKQHAQYYWTSVFIPYFNFARWNSSEKYQKNVYNIASDFIKQSDFPSELDFYTKRTKDMIVNNTLEKSCYKLYRLLKITETMDKKVYKFIGIPVYKIKIFPDYQKYYLFGIQYKIKH